MSEAPSGRPSGKDDPRMKAALAAYQDAMRRGLTWRRSVRDAVRAYEAHPAAPAPTEDGADE